MTLARARAMRCFVPPKRGLRAPGRPPPRARRRPRCPSARPPRARGPARGRAPKETSRCSHAGRSSTPAPGTRPPDAHGSGLCPHSPAIAFGPVSTCRRTTTPPPVPVPTMTPNTTSAPAAAPSHASDSAKQFASLASRTSRPSARSRSCCRGLPLSHVEFAFFTRPVAGEIAPGIPTPTVPGDPVSASSAVDEPGDRPHRGTVVLAWRRDAPAGGRPAVRRERNPFDLRAAQVDADSDHAATCRCPRAPRRPSERGALL